MVCKLLTRDLGFVLVAIAAWRIDAMWGRSEGGWVLFSALAGLLAGLCGFLVHEWSHLAGAWLSNSVVHFPRTLRTVFLFNFDSDRNDRRQFLWMSLGGIGSSWVIAAVFGSSLPLEPLAGKVAVGLVGLGMLVSTAIEGPIAWRVARGAPIPHGSVYRSAAADGSASPPVRGERSHP